MKILSYMLMFLTLLAFHPGINAYERGEREGQANHQNFNRGGAHSNYNQGQYGHRAVSPSQVRGATAVRGYSAGAVGASNNNPGTVIVTPDQGPAPAPYPQAGH